MPAAACRCRRNAAADAAAGLPRFEFIVGRRALVERRLVFFGRREFGSIEFAVFQRLAYLDLAGWFWRIGVRPRLGLLMRRLRQTPRADWQQRAREMGFAHHTPDGEPYWDESACYGFTLPQIENDLEAATGALCKLSLEFVERSVRDERALELMKIPRHAWSLIAESWRKREPSLYGRFDFAYDGKSPPKLLEYNADTPTALFEAAVFQWHWLEDGRNRGFLPKDADQFNSLHEKLIARFAEIGQGAALHFTCMSDSAEDTGTIDYLEDCAKQAGLAAAKLDIAKIGVNGADFVDFDDAKINRLFKLYPWEFIFADPFGKSLPMHNTQFIEPPWKCLLSNKGALALMWEMEPGHPNLLPAFFMDDERKSEIGARFAQKPIWSREGANVLLVDGESVLGRTGGTYGGEGYIRQALAELPAFDGNYPVIGSWLVGDQPAGMGIREDASRITGDRSRFIPHIIE